MRIGRLWAVHVGQLIESRSPGAQVVVLLLLVVSAYK